MLEALSVIGMIVLAVVVTVVITALVIDLEDVE